MNSKPAGSRKRVAEYFYKDKACKRGHTGPFYKSTGNCVQCLLDQSKEKRRSPTFVEAARHKAKERYYADLDLYRQRLREGYDRNKDSIRAAAKIRWDTDSEYRARSNRQRKVNRLNNLERSKERDRKYQRENKDKRRAYSKWYRGVNGALLRERHREYSKRHYQRNKYRYLVRQVKRRKYVQVATPLWADYNAIAAIYKRAAEETNRTGIAYSVDHIVPLFGCNRKGMRIVCGLHWEGNLQVMPLSENKRKGKYFDQDLG